MFKLNLYDSYNNKLSEGDIVQVLTNSSRDNFCFYTEIKYLDDEQCISPFHTFAFHSFKKVDSVPENAIFSEKETRFKMWYCETEKTTVDIFDKYLIDWRACEHLLKQRCFRIEKE